MKVNAFPKISLLIMLVLLSGCKQYTTQKKVNNLEAAITSYDVALRWAEYKTAYDYHVSPDGYKPPADLDYLSEISVTGIKVVEKVINEEQTEATVKTIISYYIKTRGTVKTLKLDTKWWVNEKNNQWFIDGPFPDFK